MRGIAWVLLTALVGCGGNEDDDGDGLSNAAERDLGTDAAVADSDGDGLGDGDEVTAGTDPLTSDSDDDGLSDADEVGCVSDPLDPDEQCYACGWPHADPGDLASTGNDEGDVIADVTLVDQCEQDVRLWDLAGEYHILFMTAAW